MKKNMYFFLFLLIIPLQAGPIVSPFLPVGIGPTFVKPHNQFHFEVKAGVLLSADKIDRVNFIPNIGYQINRRDTIRHRAMTVGGYVMVFNKCFDVSTSVGFDYIPLQVDTEEKGFRISIKRGIVYAFNYELAFQHLEKNSVNLTFSMDIGSLFYELQNGGGFSIH